MPDDTTGHSPDSEADLRSEFRTLITLLALATTINNRGLSTLTQNFAENYNVISNTALSDTINAVASILVQNQLQTRRTINQRHLYLGDLESKSMPFRTRSRSLRT